jgi:hypothetical protein
LSWLVEEHLLRLTTFTIVHAGHMTTPQLRHIRANTAYPTFRTFISISTLLGFLVAACFPIAGFFSERAFGAVVGIAVGAGIAVLVKVGQEVSLMIADFTDAMIQQSSPTRIHPPTLTSASSLPMRQVSKPSESAVAPNPNSAGFAQEMATFGIRLDGTQYVYGRYRFDSQEGAVRYARAHPPT